MHSTSPSRATCRGPPTTPYQRDPCSLSLGDRTNGIQIARAETEQDHEDQSRRCEPESDYPEDLGLHEVNRDGDVTNADTTRLLALSSGTETTRAWVNYSLAARA